MIKESRVVFASDNLEKSFNALDSDDFLKKAITNTVSHLKKNAFCGVQIPKRLIPKEYKKMNINNLWKYNLPKGWRLIYTIVSENEIEIITVVLDWFNHKEYEKKFRY